MFLLVTGVVRLVRRRKRETPPELIARIAHPLAGLVAALGISIPFLMSGINTYALNSSPTLLYFGLPTDYPAVYALGFVALMFAVLTGLLVGFAVLAWVRRYWSPPKRVLFSLVAVVAVVFVPVLAHWGLVTLLF